MTLHRLGAGDGYTYLTRQTASNDALRGRLGLSEYYAASGNPPGRWLGAGAELLGVGGEVSERQMRYLFGEGLHPDSGEQLGRRLFVFRPTQERVEAKVSELRGELGREPDAAAVERIRVGELLRERQAVAGWDCVFTPVKSASVLWALAGQDVRWEVEEAHREAWENVLATMETEVALTRVGTNGIAQVQTRGLTAVAFVHRDSRCGDPNLHTHVVISNKVQGPDGRWRTLDSQALHRAAVTMSERYNTRFEDAMRRRLGVVFEPRTGRDEAGRKRPVREVAGVAPELVEAFSTRRKQVEKNLGRHVEQFRARTGREPDAGQLLRLCEDATLDGRPAKAAAVPFAEQLTGWRSRAVEVIGGRRVERVERDTLGTVSESVVSEAVQLPAGQVDALAGQVLARVEESRATWTRWNVEAEVERATRALHAQTPAARQLMVGAVVDRALHPERALSLTPPALVDEPEQLRRSDGQSVFTRRGAGRFTSARILAAEQHLVAAGSEFGGPVVPGQVVDEALVRAGSQDGEGGGLAGLAVDQADAVRRFTGSGRRLDVLIGPAGAGKTTTMRAVVDAWHSAGLPVVALAPSAAAADVLSQATGVRAENVSKWLYESDVRPGLREAQRAARPAAPGAGGPARRDAADEQADAAHAVRWRLQPGQLVLVDEASMVGTLDLERLVVQAERAGAAVRLLGDHRQLTAVQAGGALRLLANTLDVAELTTVRRFDGEWEGPASLRLRVGDATVLGSYLEQGRVSDGSAPVMAEAVYRGWLADTTAGQTALMIASDTATVTALGERARADRIAAGQVQTDGVELRDGTTAGVGDRVVTRRNDRRLAVFSGADFVKNRDLWQVTDRHRDGSLTVQHTRHAGRVRLPAAYVAEHVELAYATTGHGAQGLTVDTAHALLGPGDSREYAYVAATRATSGNHLYVVTAEALDVEVDHAPEPPAGLAEAFARVLASETAERPATELLTETLAAQESLATLLPRYDYAATAAKTDRFVQLVHDTLDPARAAGVLADAAWGALAQALRQCEDLGLDAAAVLPAALGERETNTADSLAQVLHHRVDRRYQAAYDRRSLVDDDPIAGLFPRARGTGDGPLGGYLREVETAIAGRVAALGEQAAEQAPGWTVTLGAAPADAIGRLSWVTAAGMIAGYREAYGVNDELEPLGEPPPAGTVRHAAWNSATGALELVAEAAAFTGGDAAELAEVLAGWDSEVFPADRVEPGGPAQDPPAGDPAPRRRPAPQVEVEQTERDRREPGREWER